MFDNLKKKLGSFRSDAEEAAEEKAEPVADEALEDESVADEDPEDESVGDKELEDGSTAEAEPSADVDAGSADVDAGVDADTDTDTDTDADADADANVDSVNKPDAAAEAPDPEAGTAADSGPALDSDSPQTPDESDVPTADSDAPAQTGSDSGSDVDADTSGESEAAVADDTVDDDADEADETDSDSDNSNSNGTGFGRKAKSLVKGKFVIEEDDLEDPLYELELALLSSDVEMGVAEQILDNIRENLIGETRTFTTSTGAVVEEALREAILEVISVGQFDFDERVAIADKPLVIIFTGVNGVGKTTSIAKLSRYLEERGFSSVMANGDTYRAGANEQIAEHAAALDTKLIAHDQGGDPAAVLYDAVEYAEANEIDVVLGDTAGRLHTNEDLMAQLEKIERVVGPDMTLFVDEAVAGQDAINRAREFNDAAEIDGTILTKADADSNGGAAISVAHVTGKPILFLGVGQGYADIERFDPEAMVDRLLAEE